KAAGRQGRLGDALKHGTVGDNGDELFTQSDGVFPAYILALSGVGGVAPQEGIFMCAGQAGELSADDPEDFNGAQAWNQEAELAGVGCRGRLPSHIRAGTGTALDESFSLKVQQRPPHSRSRDLKSFDEL